MNPVLPFHQDYADMFFLLNKHLCSYVVVGAYAMSAYGYIRMTGDIDILVDPVPDNAVKVFAALKDFGAPLNTLSVEDFMKPGLIYQIGISPIRIDIITAIDGVDAATAIKTAEIVSKDGIDIPFLSIDNIILNKKSTGRNKDLVDAEEFYKHITEENK